MWAWIGIGLCGFSLLLGTVAFAVARVLGTIAEKISQLQQTDDWAMLPPSRSTQRFDRREPDDGVRTRVA